MSMKKSTSIASQKATSNSLEKKSIEVSSSILPPPKDLKEYEEIIPNCRERLMKGWKRNDYIGTIQLTNPLI